MKIRLHAFEPASRANGPGLRAVVWFQGCTLGCHGCFNPGTHDAAGGYEEDTAKLADTILALRPEIEGVTLSGGEPLQQPGPLLNLLQTLRGSALSVLVFSGFTLSEIRVMTDGPAILSLTDVLVAGRYETSTAKMGWPGSPGKRMHLLSNRYRPTDFARIPGGEIILHPDGSFTCSGLQKSSFSACY